MARYERYQPAMPLRRPFCGPQGTVVAELGTPFRSRGLLATITLCPIASMSHPLLVAVRSFIEGPAGGRPLPLSLFGRGIS
jgi:hypothetical protein